MRMTADAGSATGAPARVELVDVVCALAGARTLDEVAGIVRAAARRLTGADGATFVLRSGGDCHYVDEDAISPLWKGKRFPLETCVSGWAMLHRQAAVISDIYADERIPHDVYRPTFVRSLVMVPIRTSDPVGAIGSYWATTRAPTDDEVRLLQALADSTAVALDNVRLYAELEARVDERTAELQAANEELRRFTGVIAHDVRQPLTTIHGFAELLDSAPEARSDASRSAIRAILRATDNLTGFVNGLLDFATASNRAPAFAPVATAELVHDVVARLQHDIAARDASVTWSGLPEIDGDRRLLSQALQNLVSNALDHTPVDRKPMVLVTVTGDGAGWELAVSDNGCGVAPHERDRVVEAFQRGAGAASSGAGLGLATCRKVAELHGGTLEIADADIGGARISLRVPVSSR